MMQHPSLKWLRTLPIQPILIVPFLLQILLAVGLVGYLSFKNGQKAVNDLADQLIDKASQQVDDHLDHYLALPIQLTQINVDAINNRELDLNDAIASGRYFWRQAKAFPNLSYIGYVLPDGREVGAGRWVKGVDLLLYENRSNQQASDYIADDHGNRAELLQTYQFDPLSESGYKNTIRVGRLTWNAITTIEANNLELTETGKALSIRSNALDGGVEYYVALPATAPFYDKNRNLLGITRVELTLTKISTLLRRLQASASGQVFVLERTGQLIGSSGSQPVLYRTGQEVKRYSTIDTPDPLIRTVAEAMQQRFKTIQAIQTSQKFDVAFNGERQFVQVTPWRDPYGLDWLVVVTVPESDFMTQIHANTHTTFWLCVGALGVATVLGLYTAQWITRPILRLSQAAEAIALGNLDQSVEVPGVRELGSLARSFNQMTQQVRESFTALEQTNEQLEQRVEARTLELQNTLKDLRYTQAQMLQSEKMSSLGQMVAGVAHEINNPVNFIHGNVEYVERYSQELLELVQLYQREFPQSSAAIAAKMSDIDLAFLSEDLLKLLASMRLGTDRIRDIVKSLRTFSRVDEADLKAVDIHEGIESTLLILQHRLKAQPNRAAVSVIRAFGELPLIECHPGQLNQVVMNILSNAIDALEEVLEPHDFLGQITIRTSMIEANWAQIAIADNGPGMPETVRQRLYDPFFTTKPVGKGTGMGLSISYQLITKNHGGKLECRSKLGTGTEFLIQIPVRAQSIAAS